MKQANKLFRLITLLPFVVVLFALMFTSCQPVATYRAVLPNGVTIYRELPMNYRVGDTVELGYKGKDYKVVLNSKINN